jgi:hypothetical protein
MNLVITMHDASMAANVGGGVESESYIVKVPDGLVPPSVIAYIENHDKYKYTAMTLSFARAGLQEDTP